MLYIAGNVGVFLYYWQVRRDEFNPILHAIFPLLSSAALIVVGCKSLRPLPPTPTSYGALLAIGWLLIGAVVLLVMWQTGRDRWLLNAGKVFEEAPAVPADSAA